MWCNPDRDQRRALSFTRHVFWLAPTWGTNLRNVEEEEGEELGYLRRRATLRFVASNRSRPDHWQRAKEQGFLGSCSQQLC